MRRIRLFLPLACAAFALLALDACEDKKDGGDSKSSAEKPAAEKKAEPAPAKAEAPAAPAVPALVERDVTEDAKQHIPVFPGTKMTLLAPADAVVKAGIGGFDVKTEGFGLSVAQGANKAAAIVGKITDGSSAVKEAKIVEQGEGFVLYEGKAFGKHGFFVHVDLPAIGGLISACSTPMAQGYPLENAKAVLKACQSVKIE